MKIGEVKTIVALFGKVSQHPAFGYLFDTFLKLLYLINYPFIHPCFARSYRLVEVHLRGLKGDPPSISTSSYVEFEE